MKVTCPECSQLSEDINKVEGMISCEFCQKWFTAPVAAHSPHVKAALEMDASRRQEKIRRQARRFELVAVIFLALALLALALGVFLSISADPRGGSSCLALAAGSLGAALWVYVIAQVVHIRANTES